MAEAASAAAAPQGSLAGRVVSGVLSVLLIGGIVVAAASLAYGRQAARAAYDRLLLGAATHIAESVDIEGGAPVAHLPVSAFELLALAPDDRIGYAVRAADGTLLTGHAGVAPPRTDRAERGPAPPYRFFDGRLDGEAARFVTRARRFAERDYSGVVTVTVGQTLRARSEMALTLTRDALIAAVLFGAVLMILAVVVIRHAMRPLARIAADLSARDPHDLTPMSAAVPAEAAVMIAAMNRFMQRLDRQVASMRNLISDTAHQLRTPVAAIRAQAELALDEPDPAARQAMLDRLAGRTRSLGDLLDQMLSRALVIHRTESAPRVTVDLRDVALSVIEAEDHRLLAPGIEVGLVIGEEPVEVDADEMSLTEAARNLLGNALRHGRAPVRIGVDGGDGRARLWVEDAGPGPAPEVLARLGQRFERAAASRGQSAGLGLSIGRAVAEAFGGRLTMARTEGGFRVTLDLPALAVRG